MLQQKKPRAAMVIVGGIRGTFFPDEPLDKGTDGVFSGNGDVAWPQAIQAQNTAQGRPGV
jgi:hypothetical protein